MHDERYPFWAKTGGKICVSRIVKVRYESQFFFKQMKKRNPYHDFLFL